jgi:hypothetical protein
MARPAGFEPATLGLEGRCSIQMSYGRSHLGLHITENAQYRQKNGRGREIRTPDILLPKQARYQTALYPGFSLRAKRRHDTHAC